MFHWFVFQWENIALSQERSVDTEVSWGCVILLCCALWFLVLGRVPSSLNTKRLIHSCWTPVCCVSLPMLDARWTTTWQSLLQQRLESETLLKCNSTDSTCNRLLCGEGFHFCWSRTWKCSHAMCTYGLSPSCCSCTCNWYLISMVTIIRLQQYSLMF